MDDHYKKLFEAKGRIMRKHRLIHDHELPAVLLKPLVFGDVDQIRALSDLEERIDREASKKAKIASGDVNFYDVTLVYSATEHIRVVAIDENDAEEKAIALSEHDGLGFGDVDVESVTKVKGK